MANNDFIWNKSDILITYDLTRNDVSASQIAEASGGYLHTSIAVAPHSYPLPNTTLWYSGTKEAAKEIFLRAFRIARGSSQCVIHRLLVTEVSGMSAYIED